MTLVVDLMEALVSDDESGTGIDDVDWRDTHKKARKRAKRTPANRCPSKSRKEEGSTTLLTLCSYDTTLYTYISYTF